MGHLFISYKYFEYLSRAALASKKHDKVGYRDCLRSMILVQRLAARDAVDELVKANAALTAAERSMKKAKKQGITFTLGEKKIEQLKEPAKEARAKLSAAGETLSVALDMWQRAGATLWDLCNLCNRDYGKVLEEVREDRMDETFSSLIFVYNLDYKDTRNRGWIDYDVDAPLTHAIKEYFLDLMLHTAEGRAASHKALEECFPEVMENAMTMVTDDDGVKHLIDKDGVEVGTVGEED